VTGRGHSAVYGGDDIRRALNIKVATADSNNLHGGGRGKGGHWALGTCHGAQCPPAASPVAMPLLTLFALLSCVDIL